jgi:hypothetical protein
MSLHIEADYRGITPCGSILPSLIIEFDFTPPPGKEGTYYNWVQTVRTNSPPWEATCEESDLSTEKRFVDPYNKNNPEYLQG